jgi:hypothetical protein
MPGSSAHQAGLSVPPRQAVQLCLVDAVNERRHHQVPSHQLDVRQLHKAAVAPQERGVGSVCLCSVVELAIGCAGVCGDEVQVAGGGAAVVGAPVGCGVEGAVLLGDKGGEHAWGEGSLPFPST